MSCLSSSLAHLDTGWPGELLCHGQDCDRHANTILRPNGIQDLESGFGKSLPLLSSADHEYRPMFTSRTPVSPRVTYHVAEHQSNGGWENDFGEGINA